MPRVKAGSAGCLRGLEPVPLDEPGGVVGLLEGEQGLTELFQGAEGPHPQEVLFQGADEALGAAVLSAAPRELPRLRR